MSCASEMAVNYSYHGEDGRRNGVAVILKEDYTRRVLEVKIVPGRLMYMKLDKERCDDYCGQCICPTQLLECMMEEKDNFWTNLDEFVERIPKEERLLIGADFNRRLGEGNKGDEDVMVRPGDKGIHADIQTVEDVANRMELVVVNTYFTKREVHRVTYTSGGRSTQVEYIICRTAYLKEIAK